jgi:hypothetical protein
MLLTDIDQEFIVTHGEPPTSLRRLATEGRLILRPLYTGSDEQPKRYRVDAAHATNRNAATHFEITKSAYDELRAMSVRESRLQLPKSR